MKRKPEDSVDEVVAETTEKEVEPKFLYIANNDTFVIECQKEVTVLVDGLEFGRSSPINGIATVRGRELPEFYQYAIK